MPDAIASPIVIALGNVGYQTDLPRTARGLTHYEKADNVIFEVGQQVRKFGGAEKINASPVSGNVTGMFDFWFGGGSVPFEQKFIAVANGHIYKEDMDGVFDDITGGAVISTNAIPVFGVATNKLVIAFNTRNVILYWDGAAASVSAMPTAPLGKGFVFHANRGWIWDGSILYYSKYGDITNWTGADTGNIAVRSGDGDEIIGCASHTKDNLIIFKGPNNGSIHILTGSSPTGDEAFSFPNMAIRGIALQTHNSIIPLANGDLAFRTPRGVHLLSVVQEFGDFAPRDVTRFLKRHFRSNLSRANLAAEWGVDYKEKSAVFWNTTTIGGVAGNQMLGLSYGRIEEDGWKAFTVTRECTSMAMRKNPTTKIDEIVTGSADGFVRRQDTETRAIDTTIPYAFNLTSPHLVLGTADATGKPRGDQPVTLEGVYLRAQSVGEYTLFAVFQRDNLPAESYLFSLGTTAGLFILGTSILGGPDTLGGTDKVTLAYSEPPSFGECRTLKFSIFQGGVNQDANLIEAGLEFTPLAQSRKSLSDEA